MMQQKKAVLYCRVSTKEQVEEGNSLVTQERHCREYAHKHGFEVAALFVEQGESAKTADRTELRKLMSFCAVKKNSISAIIAYKIDRISRNIDDYSQIRIQLKRYGVEIKSTSENFEDTPAGRFMENIIANVAQFDNDVRAERSIGGMKDAVREGRYVWQAPYGYSNIRVNGKSTIGINDFAPIILQVFEEIAANKYPIEETRRKMILSGLLLPKGRPISKSCFYRLIRNELYTGWINQFGERHKGNFEPIISEQLYSKVQAVLSPKKALKHQYLGKHPDFPLRRFFRHPSGFQMTAYWSQGKYKKYPYYMIHKTGINIRKEVLESKFKDFLNATFKMDIIHFEKLHGFLNNTLSSRIGDLAMEQNAIQNKIQELKVKQKALIIKNISGVINDALCKENLAEMDERLFDLHSKLINLPKMAIDKAKVLNIVRSIFLSPGELWQNSNLEGKIKLQRFYFPDGIEITKDESRTYKLCRLFKLKQQFLPVFSPMVNHPDRKLNTKNWQILTIDPKALIDTSFSEISEELLDYEGREELADIAKVIEGEDDLDPSVLPRAA